MWGSGSVLMLVGLTVLVWGSRAEMWLGWVRWVGEGEGIGVLRRKGGC